MTQGDKTMRRLLLATAGTMLLCLGILLTEWMGYRPPSFVPAAVRAVAPAEAEAPMTEGRELQPELPPEAPAESKPAASPSAGPAGASTPAEAVPSARVNINTATLEELTSLPGIGPVIGQNILNYRQRVGGFTSVEQLLYVERIGEKTLEKLRPLITV